MPAATSQRVQLAPMLAWSLIAVGTIYLAFVGGGWQGIYSAQLRTLSLALILTALGVWLGVAVVRPQWRPKTVLWPAFVVSLAVMAISLAASPTPRVGADYLAYAVILTGLYLLLQRLMANEYFRPRLTAWTIVLTAGVCLWYVVVCVNDWVRWWGLVGNVVVPPLRPYFEGLLYGNPSPVMTMAVLLFAPAAAHLGFDSTGRRLAVGTLAVLVLVVTFLTGSRAGWLALAAGVGGTALIWLASAGHRRALLRLATPGVRIAVIVLASLVVIAAVVLGPAIFLRLDAGGESFRLAFYRSALRMFQTSPLVGTGPGTWVVQRPAFTLPDETDYYIPHAHDVYLQTLAEFGVLGVAAGLVVIVAVAWLIRDGIRDPDPVRARFGWFALLSTTYFAAHNVLDSYANVPAILFAWAIPIAYLDATARRLLIEVGSQWVRRGRGARLAAATAGGVLLVAAGAWLMRSESAALAMSDGVAAADGGDWVGALPDLRAAAEADPDLPAYQFAYGLALANTGQRAEAADALERSARVDDLPAAWLDVAALRAEMGDPDRARDALEKALRLGIQEPGINLAAGTIWLEIGDVERARTAFVTSVLQLPSLAGDPWWQTGSARELWPSVLEIAVSSPSRTTAFEIALASGDAERARSVAAELTGSDAEFYGGLILPAWNGDQEALAALYARAANGPYETRTLQWAARLASRGGDAGRAARYRSWADGMNPGASTGGYEIRVVPPDKPFLGVGITSTFHGHYTYRRPTPVDQLIVGLPHLGLV